MSHLYSLSTKYKTFLNELCITSTYFVTLFFFLVLREFELRALHLLSKTLSLEKCPQPFLFFLSSFFSCTLVIFQIGSSVFA
jgi:hypothetical protein